MLGFYCLTREGGVNMERKGFGEKLVTLPLLINGVLFTLTIVLLQNLLGAGNLNVWQTISLILFVIALPCLAGYAYIIYAIQAAKVDPQAKGKTFLLLQYIGIATDLLGIWANITNSSWIAGLIFFVVSIVAFVICSITYNHIVEILIEPIHRKRRYKSRNNIICVPQRCGRNVE
jgi:hypothetical protein